MPHGDEFHTAGAATLKPWEANVVQTRGTDNKLVFAERYYLASAVSAMFFSQLTALSLASWCLIRYSNGQCCETTLDVTQACTNITAVR